MSDIFNCLWNLGILQIKRYEYVGVGDQDRMESASNVVGDGEQTSNQ